MAVVGAFRFMLNCANQSVLHSKHCNLLFHRSKYIKTFHKESYVTCSDLRSNVFVKQSRLASSSTNQTLAISPLHTVKKRVPRKKPIDKEEQLLKNLNVIAFATAKEYDIEKLREELVKNSPYIPTEVEDFHRSDLLYTEINSRSECEQKQIYIFQEGAVVLWNIPENECNQILKFIKKFENSSYEPSIIINEQEAMPYSYSKDVQSSDLVNGQFVLAAGKGNVTAALDRYTFSNAMVVSVKLGIWESILEHSITSIEALTNDLKNGGKIRISREEVLKKTGELFALRHSVNLSSDVLDVPDFYWDRDELEKLYLKTSNYFSINRRTKVVNEKLNHCLELLDLISSILNDKHHIRLEWMIIILIMFEVGIASVHLLFGF